MIHINEYLLSKKNSKLHDWTPFPARLSKKSLLEFFEANRFTRSSYEAETMPDIYEYFDNNWQWSYMMKEYDQRSFWARFFDDNEITKDNPIFVVQIEKRYNPESLLFGIETTEMHDYDYKAEQFAKMVDDHFKHIKYKES